MRIAITDYTFPDLEIEEAILREEGHQIVAWKEKRSAAELSELVADADAVITQFAPVDAGVIDSMRRARVIVRYGIGVDNVDLTAASAKGIPVCNIPDYCIHEVADHTLAFILATTRQVVPHCIALRSGQWGLVTSVDQMRAMCDLTVGVIGFGRIGREVASRLRSFQCQVVVHDPGVEAAEVERAGCSALGLEELLAVSDVVTLHCPSTARTRHLINRDTLATMKPGVILVNVARGDIVDASALIDALRSGQVSGAALDVFVPEPLPSDHALLQMDNVIVASHIASVSVPAVRKLRETAARLAATALRGESLPNIVNGVSQ
ncbi:MAG: C-terminal binding protein [Pirellulaceae bacterium]